MTGCWGWLRFESRQNGGGSHPVAFTKRSYSALVTCVAQFGEEECVDPDAVDGAFAILAGSGAHQEPGCGDGDQEGIDGMEV